ncbi:hypothetical protein GCK72_018321 [Caenorhabditis remanei]|uniref:Uncharacterized protein n=1 Tax=Caenorhabditis remanei TaxID=31234 RepID=A0A6A5G9I1_CAERE|nr:hypothetical protein GCK72_018321 [Caenorhabditis remanei]KAF1751767.1 hypothetical protein GCK72_018321 [Caenorhabditis remanei]
MAFRQSYGMPSYPHYPQQQQQQIVFGQMRMPGQHQPPHQKTHSKPELTPAVFVGNISEKCSDEFFRQILNECGEVASWKRIKTGNGKFNGFGFCTFTDLEGTLRALRILHEFHLGDKKLTVKAEGKVLEDLRRDAIENRKKQGKKELKLKPDELPADEDDLKKDEEIRLKILNWMETDHKELFSITEDGEISEESKKAREQEGKSEKHAPLSTSTSHKKDDYKRSRHRRSRTRSRERTSRRSRSKESPRNKKSRRSRSSSSSSSESDSSSSRSSSYSSRSRSRTPQRSKASKRRRSNSRVSEDSDDAREKRQMKQLMKEKEQAYHARLKRWESRERGMSKKYEREERKEKDRKKSLQKEGKRLKLFLEDYDDEKDDPKYYKSSQFFQRKRDYEREREADQKDRIQEIQEIEELKKQIMEEAANDESINIDEEARKRHKLKEDEALRKMRADSGSPNPHQPLGQSAKGDNGESSSEDESSSEKNNAEADGVKMEPMDHGEGTSVQQGEELNAPGAVNGGAWKSIGDDATLNPQIARPVANGNQPQVKKEASPLPIVQRLNGVFGNDDDEDDENRKKKLKPFQITREERMQVMSAEEKKELTKQIIKKIPLTKEELFVHKIEWDQLDRKWMDNRIRPWVAKKVNAFLGEDDQSLCDFICEQIGKQATPEEILKDIAMIIDEDAEQFVIKMWRLLIYEGQARRMGIT